MLLTSSKASGAIGGTIGAAGGAAASTALVFSSVLGGAGAFVVGSIAFPPALVISGSVFAGLLAVGGIGVVVSALLRRYREHSTTTSQHLERLVSLCNQMEEDAREMAEKSNGLSKACRNLSSVVGAVRNSMLSEAQRKKHAEIYRTAKTINQDLIWVLREIIDLKFVSLTAVEPSLIGRNQRAIRQ